MSSATDSDFLDNRTFFISCAPSPIPANRNESKNLMPASLSTSAAAVAKSSRKAMLWKSPCLMGVVRTFRSNFLNSSPATISKSGANALAMMIHDGSLRLCA
ncbi:MAG: hypothetical protein WA130_09080 [Candidatus Methanoperedens sp.]